MKTFLTLLSAGYDWISVDRALYTLYICMGLQKHYGYIHFGDLLYDCMSYVRLRHAVLVNL